MKIKTSVLALAGAVSCAAAGALIFGPGTAQAAPSNSPGSVRNAASFQDVRDALTGGKDVTVTVRFQRCADSSTGAAGPFMTGGLHINGYQATSENVLFSDVHPTLDTTDHPVTEYIHYAVTPNNELTVSTRTLGGQEVIHSASFTCELGDGARFTWNH